MNSILASFKFVDHELIENNVMHKITYIQNLTDDNNTNQQQTLSH